MPSKMSDEELIAAISGHESLAPLSSQQLLDLGEGVKAPSPDVGTIEAFEPSIAQQFGNAAQSGLESLGVGRSSARNVVEGVGDVLSAPKTVAEELSGAADVDSLTDNLGKGEFGDAAIDAGLLFLPDLAQKPLEAMFMLARRGKSKVEMDEIFKLVESEDYKALREDAFSRGFWPPHRSLSFDNRRSAEESGSRPRWASRESLGPARSRMR